MTQVIEREETIDLRVEQPAPSPRHRYRPGAGQLAALAAVIVAARVGIGLALGKAGLAVMPLGESWPRPSTVSGDPHSLAVAMNRWDADLIARISQNGYLANDISMTSFFPVYPLLVRLVHTLGLSYEWSSVVVSTLAFFAATWGVLTLARKVLPQSNYLFAGLVFAWCPTSVFLFAGYTEATYAALVSWFLVAVVHKRWLVAAVLAGIGSAARPEGALLGITLFLWMAWNRQWVKAFVCGFIAELGLLAFSIFCFFRYDNFFAYFTAQADWHRERALPFAPALRSARELVFGTGLEGNAYVTTSLNVLMIALATAGAGVLIWKAWRAEPLRPLAIYVAVTLLVVVSNAPHGHSVEAAGRVLMCAAPLFVLAALVRRPIISHTVLASSASLAVFFGLFFQLGHWFT